MAGDYLPFERVSYSKPSKASISEAVWIWHILSDVFPPGGPYGDFLIYTMPSGLKGIISDISVSGTFTGVAKFFIGNGDNIFFTCFERFFSSNLSFQLPPVAEPEQEIYFRFWNLDIVTGQLVATMSMWNVPGSQPEKPKSNDPEERFKKGDFSSADLIYLPNNEVLITFHKRNDLEKGLLRIRDYGKKTEKLISKFYLRVDDANQLVAEVQTEPEKAKEVLERLEKKFKMK